MRVSVGPSMRAHPAICAMPPSRANRPTSMSWVSVELMWMSVASLWISTVMSSGSECRKDELGGARTEEPVLAGDVVVDVRLEAVEHRQVTRVDVVPRARQCEFGRRRVGCDRRLRHGDVARVGGRRWASASRMFTWCTPKNGKQIGPDTPRYGSVTCGS